MLTRRHKPTQSRFWASQRHAVMLTRRHKPTQNRFWPLKDMQSCSHGDTNLHKTGFGLFKRHAHRAVIHTTQCRFFWVPFKDTHAHRETHIFSFRESRAKRNHTATVGPGKPHHTLRVAGVKVFTHGSTETVCL